MFELIILFVLLLVVISIVYTSLKVGISPMPSSFKACRAMIEATKDNKSQTIIDVGSGFGFLALNFASKYPHTKVIGYEISFFPWAVSMALKWLSRYDNITFHHKNFLNEEFDKESLIVCYLFPKGMSDLEVKLNNENIDITCVVSNTFSFPQKKPKKIIYLDDLYKTPIYIY